MGKKMVAVEELLVTSVTPAVMRHSISTSAHTGRESNPANESPIALDNPDLCKKNRYTIKKAIRMSIAYLAWHCSGDDRWGLSAMLFRNGPPAKKKKKKTLVK